jgi:16S rRNA (cytidine1402-2'-O)-methyltransferase
LVAAARLSGCEVISIPGPCAATTALVSSGLPTDRFCFEGFLPAKGRERRDRLAFLASEQRTSVIYEAPHRLCQLLEELLELCGEERPLQVARELTKRHEQQVGPTVGAARNHFQEHSPQGECTVVLGGAVPVEIEPLSDTQCCEQLLALTAEGMSAKDAAKLLSSRIGRSKRELYALLHAETEHAD